MDALENYVSALGYPDGKLFKGFWPANYHVIGTDINFFHSVIWPAMLMSAGISLPQHVFVHGFVNIGGKKMSKSSGVVIDPLEIVKAYGVDQLRYFFCRDIPFGEDGDFSEEALKQRINGELVSDLGNLVNRVLTLAERYEGRLEGKPELEQRLDFAKINGHMLELRVHHALDGIMGFVRETNKYVNEKQAWKLNGKEMGHVLYNLLESLRVISILLFPFMPSTAESIASQLGTKITDFSDLKFREFEGKPEKRGLLFGKV